MEDYARVKRDPHPNRLWPVVVAALCSLPLLFLSMRFSLLAADFMQPMVQLGVAFPILAYMFVLASAGWFAIAATIVTLWIALARRTFKWRLIWCGIAVLCAGLLPLSWLVTGALMPEV